MDLLIHAAAGGRGSRTPGRRCGPRGAGPTAGMVTAEAAVAVGSLVMALAMLLQVFVVVAAHLQVGDAARTAARSLARGDDPAAARAAAHRSAPGAVVDVDAEPGGALDVVRVRASRSVALPLLPWWVVQVHADATASIESAVPSW